MTVEHVVEEGEGVCPLHQHQRLRPAVNHTERLTLTGQSVVRETQVDTAIDKCIFNSSISYSSTHGVVVVVIV